MPYSPTFETDPFNPDFSRSKKDPPAHFAEGKIHFALEVESKNHERFKEEIQQKKIPIFDSVIWKDGQEPFILIILFEM